MKNISEIEFKKDNNYLVKYYHTDKNNRVSTPWTGTQVLIDKGLKVFQLRNSYSEGGRLAKNTEISDTKKLQARPIIWFVDKYYVSFASVFTDDVTLLPGREIKFTDKNGNVKPILCADKIYRMAEVKISSVQYKVCDPEKLLDKLSPGTNLFKNFLFATPTQGIVVNGIDLVEIIKSILENNQDVIEILGGTKQNGSNQNEIKECLNKIVELINGNFCVINYGIELTEIRISVSLSEEGLSETHKDANNKKREKDETTSRIKQEKITTIIDLLKAVKEKMVEKQGREGKIIEAILNNPKVVEEMASGKKIPQSIGGRGSNENVSLKEFIDVLNNIDSSNGVNDLIGELKELLDNKDFINDNALLE